MYVSTILSPSTNSPPIFDFPFPPLQFSDLQSIYIPDFLLKIDLQMM